MLLVGDAAAASGRRTSPGRTRIQAPHRRSCAPGAGRSGVHATAVARRVGRVGHRAGVRTRGFRTAHVTLTSRQLGRLPEGTPARRRAGRGAGQRGHDRRARRVGDPLTRPRNASEPARSSASTTWAAGRSTRPCCARRPTASRSTARPRTASSRTWRRPRAIWCSAGTTRRPARSAALGGPGQRMMRERVRQGGAITATARALRPRRQRLRRPRGSAGRRPAPRRPACREASPAVARAPAGRS